MADSIDIIIITDGDKKACAAVEEAGRQLGLRTISASMGNPSPLSGSELVALIKQAPSSPVLVMVDDSGSPLRGKGEELIGYLNHNSEVSILGVVAVASNISRTQVNGIAVDFSIDSSRNVVQGPVDKNGHLEAKSHKFVEGDTVDVLNEMDVPIIVGIGDIGKMQGLDSAKNGACVTTKAIQEILNRSGVYAKTTHQ